MKNINSLLGMFLVVLMFSSCGNKELKQPVEKDYTELDSLLYETNYWRYKSLDSAFNYSYKALEKAEKKNIDTTISMGLVKLGGAYLNHANLFYLCSRFDSTEVYINKYDNLKYNNIPIGNLAAIENIVSEEMFYEYTYLRMLRDIQNVEINLRRLDFEGTTKLLNDIPLIALHKQISYDSNTDSVKNKKIYGCFYNSNKWLWAKIEYNIKYAVYNFYIPSGDEYIYMDNCFDALFQISRVSDTTTQYAARQVDESTLFYYNYVLANTYYVLANLIANDTINNYVNTYISKFFQKGDTLNFKFKEDKDFLRKYNLNKEKNPQEIAKQYYYKAYKIYLEQLFLLKKDTNIYWKANFMQNLANFNYQLKKGEIKNIYKKHLDNCLLLDTITEYYFIESDRIFTEWGGGNIDFFQSAGSKYFLSNYYYSEYKEDTTKYKYLDKAVSLLDTAVILINSATLHNAFSFQIKKLCYGLLHKMNSSKYNTEWKEIEFFDKYVYEKTKANIAIYRNERKAEREKGVAMKETNNIRYIAIILIFILLICIWIISQYIRKIKEKEQMEKEKMEKEQMEKEQMEKEQMEKEQEKLKSTKGLNKCYETYIRYRRSPELIRKMTKAVADNLFEKDCKLAMIICLPDKESTLVGVGYDPISDVNNNGIIRYSIKDERHQAIECFNNGTIKYSSINDKKISAENIEYFPFPEIEKATNPSKIDLDLKSLLFIPLSTEESKVPLGVISFQLTKDIISKSEFENCQSLAKFIATSTKGEFDELKILKNSLRTISNINYSNLTRNDYEKQIKNLFDIVYKFMFGIDSEKSKKEQEDLFAIALWLEESKKEEDMNDILLDKNNPTSYMSPILKENTYHDKETSILVEYSYERYINNKKEIINQPNRKACYLHDYSSRPAIYCFAKNKAIKDRDKNYISEMTEYYYWKDNKNKTEYKKYIENIFIDSRNEDYKNYIKEEYIKKLDDNIFYNTASNQGLQTNSMLFYPITVGNEIKGILSFQHEKPHYFLDTHKIILKIVANLIGITMENADLMKQKDHILWEKDHISQQNEEFLRSEQLRYVLDNHYVKNVLSSFLSTDIINKKSSTKEYFSDFIKLYKFLLSAKKEQEITIEDDFDFLYKYVSLYDFKGSKIYLSCYYENCLKKEKVLPLILQPFVENAIKHGIRASDKEIIGTITIKYEKIGQILKCTITDNGQGLTARKKQQDESTYKDSSSGIGTETIRNILRFELQKSQNSHLRIEDPVVLKELVIDGKVIGTEATIYIPIINQ